MLPQFGTLQGSKRKKKKRRASPPCCSDNAQFSVHPALLIRRRGNDPKIQIFTPPRPPSSPPLSQIQTSLSKSAAACARQVQMGSVRAAHVGGEEPPTVPAFSRATSLHASLAVLIDSNLRLQPPRLLFSIKRAVIWHQTPNGGSRRRFSCLYCVLNWGVKKKKKPTYLQAAPQS